MLRLFTPADLGAGLEVQASPAQAHYLGSVMRRGVGEAVALFNGRDGAWQARLMALRRGEATLAVEALLQPQGPEPDLVLLFALLKRDATDLAVQKATELGVSQIQPVITARTQADRVNMERLAAIAREAAEQCERLSVPEILPPQKLLPLLAAWPAQRQLAVAIERGAPRPVPHGAGALLVGPEGGFAPTELDVLRAARFVSPICLGPRILRAETAIIAGLALLQQHAWSG